MELKWLEDFVCVAEKGHFARAAQERLVTQSALSRRIQSLESWVGTELLDRSQHPIQLTPAGNEFIKFARDLIAQSYRSRAVTSEFAKIGDSSITVACLHTLALNYVPQLIHDLQDNIGHFATSVIADARTVDEYLTSLFSGTCDFFICYSHPSIKLDIDKEHFPHIELDQHWVRPYQSIHEPEIDLSNDSDKLINYLEYSTSTYMTLVVTHCIKNAPFRRRLRTVYRSSLAESILTATQNGLGLSWLPQTVAAGSAEENGLRLVSDDWSTSLFIRVYKSAKNTNKSVLDIWEHLKAKT